MPVSAQAQSTGGYYCGTVPSVSPELEASILVFTDTATPIFAEGSVGIYVCHIFGESAERRECDMVLSLPFTDFVSAQWIGSRTLAIETTSLQTAGHQLELSMVMPVDSPAATVRIDRLTSFAADSDQQIGERKAMDESIRCSMIPPPPPPPTN
jgi:hypothetical protein